MDQIYRSQDTNYKYNKILQNITLKHNTHMISDWDDLNGLNNKYKWMWYNYNYIALYYEGSLHMLSFEMFIVHH